MRAGNKRSPGHLLLGKPGQLFYSDLLAADAAALAAVGRSVARQQRTRLLSFSKEGGRRDWPCRLASLIQIDGAIWKQRVHVDPAAIPVRSGTRMQVSSAGFNCRRT